MLGEGKWGERGRAAATVAGTRPVANREAEATGDPVLLRQTHLGALFQEVPNLAQLLYHHISQLEQAVLSN